MIPLRAPARPAVAGRAEGGAAISPAAAPPPLHVTIRLDGPPRGKGRPRRGKGMHMYTDAKTASYEAQLRFAAQQEMAGRPPTMLPVNLTMTVRFAVPNSWSKKKTSGALAGIVRPTVKPDADNILKNFDAFNGIIWGDDKQVVEARVYKVYAETPGITIHIDAIGAGAA